MRSHFASSSRKFVSSSSGALSGSARMICKALEEGERDRGLIVGDEDPPCAEQRPAPVPGGAAGSFAVRALRLSIRT
jgi:hypothetical protein